jgi:hypothetical protein
MLDENSPEWIDAHFVIKADERVGTLIANPNGAVRYVTAEADNGWRYSVVVSVLPHAGWNYEGGPMLVTVTSPWIDAHALQSTGYLSEKYVAEHLCGGPYRKVSDADAHAMTLLVCHALDRTTTPRRETHAP